MELPTEAIYEVLLHSSLKEVLKKCSTSKRFNSVCSSKQFWKIYAEEWFWLNLADNLTAKEEKDLVIKAYKILKLIKYNKILLNYEDYLYLVFEVDDEDIKRILMNYGHQGNALDNLTDRIRYSYLQDKYDYNEYYDIPLEEGENTFPDQDEEILTELGKRNMERLLREMKKSTLYTDGRDLFNLNFNNNFDIYSYQGTDLFDFLDREVIRMRGRILRFYLSKELYP